MNKKDTILIVYPPGSYGTFLEWCLVYFSGILEDDALPFRINTGSAHNYKGNPIDFPDPAFCDLTSEKYFASDLNFPIARTHGVTKSTEIVKDYINLYKDYVKFIINIAPDNCSVLLILHNTLTKFSDDGLAKYQNLIEYLCDLEPSDQHWKIREKLSFKLTDLQSYALYHAQGNDDVQLTLTVSDLLTDLKGCLQLIFDKTGLVFDPVRLSNIESIYKQWLDLQKFTHLDQLCKDIVDHTVKDHDFDWSQENLTVYAEAYIQMLLRRLHNIELKCYNLEEFPTNSNDLRKILIHDKSV